MDPSRAQYSYTLLHTTLPKLVYNKHETPYHASTFRYPEDILYVCVIFAIEYFFYKYITLNNRLECCSDGFSILVLLADVYIEQNLYVRVIFVSDCLGLYGIYEKISKNNFCREFSVL